AVRQVCMRPSHPAVLVLTGLDDEKMALQAMQHGAQDYLVKGQTDSALLVRAIRYAIERKNVQEDLYQREQQFRALAEGAPDLIARYDRSFRHLYVNPAVQRSTGLGVQELLGRTLQEAGMPRPSSEAFEQALSRVFGTGAEQTLEFSLPTPHG